MRRVVATLVVAVALIFIPGSAYVSGQGSCTFVRGFATLRDLVGPQKVGTCIEDERFNGENGNAEQKTSGGLLVWRKADNFTAFTDGGTTWVNGPNGLQSRPNDDRFSWEKDAPAPSRTSARTESSVSAGPPSGASASNAAAAAANAAAANAAPPRAAASPTPVVSTPTPPPTATPTATIALPTATPTITRTPTATPNPVTAKFDDLPETIRTGSEQKFVVDTNVKKGTCSLTIDYRNSDPAGLGAVDVDDGKCEWKYIVPEDTKTGKAKFEVSVSSTNPAGSTTFDDEVDVKEGDESYAGDLDIELDIDKFPDEASLNEEVEVAISTNLKDNKATCELTVNWPKIGAETIPSVKPNDRRCSWKLKVPATIPKKGTANVTMVVRDKDGSVKQVTKEFDVKLP